MGAQATLFTKHNAGKNYGHFKTSSIDMKGAKSNFFKFEEDFVEGNIRCIPMIVRFKLDACGIKLKLAEWSRMTTLERANLAASPCETQQQIEQYRKELIHLILHRTGNPATALPMQQNTAWAQTNEIPHSIKEKLHEHAWSISIPQWQGLTDLQRFALLKLSYPGHENKNFPKAMAEFGLSQE
jgi:hypothetical protein